MLKRKLMFLLIPALCYAASGAFEVAQVDWVRIHYHQADDANVQQILEAVNFSYPRISENLGLKFTGEVDIYLSSQPAEFGELTDWKLPKWAQGVALTSKKTIVLKSPRYSGSTHDLSKAAVHEFVHILLANEVGWVPLWLNEGLAVMLSGEGYFNDRPLTSASITGRFIPFRDLERVLKFNWADAQLAYQQSLSATRYLVSEFGWEAMRSLLWGLQSGQKYDKAFMDATGLWPDEFENEWLKKMGGKFRYSALKDLDFYVGYIFVPLLFLGGFLMWFRRRRTLKRWAEEEQYYDYYDY